MSTLSQRLQNSLKDGIDGRIDVLFGAKQNLELDKIEELIDSNSAVKELGFSIFSATVTESDLECLRNREDIDYIERNHRATISRPSTKEIEE